jgi:polyisoprenoid-binding protein YceI
VTKEVTAAIEVTGIADMGMDARAGVEAIFTVKRSDFGMKYGLDKGTLGDAVRVTVALEGVKR